MYSWRVPKNFSGEIKISCALDLGGLGETKGQPVTYNWTPPAPIYLLHIIPWIIFVFVLIPAFRIDKRSWVIFIPILISEILLLGIYIIFSKSKVSYYSIGIYPFFNPLILSFAIILLLSNSLQKRGKWVRLIRILIIFSGMGLLSLYIQQIDNPPPITNIPIYYGTMILGILSGIASARYFSRKNFSAIRFFIILLLSNLIINTILIVVIDRITTLKYDMELSSQMLIYSFKFILILTMIAFGVLLSFLVFSINNRFYCERLYLLLGIIRRVKNGELTREIEG